MKVQTYPSLDVQIKLIGPEAEHLTLLAAHQGISTTKLIQQSIQLLLKKAITTKALETDWQAMSLSAFEADWDNPEDAIYDDWRTRYGLEEG